MDIQICGLNKSFGEKQVLRNFSTRFPQGRISCVMGSSGCGKTTLLNILLGLERQDSGEITGLPERISAVFQEDRLCEPFSAQANLRLVTGKRVPGKTLHAHLRTLGLDGSLDLPVCELSGGMRRRVSIARAILYDAQLILLDEPFKGLDEATKLITMDYVRAHSAGRTLVFVTHDAAEAEYLAENIIRMQA
jgi:NitT/TauT family transport system ATP-binding protein